MEMVILTRDVNDGRIAQLAEAWREQHNTTPVIVEEFSKVVHAAQDGVPVVMVHGTDAVLAEVGAYTGEENPSERLLRLGVGVLVGFTFGMPESAEALCSIGFDTPTEAKRAGERLSAILPVDARLPAALDTLVSFIGDVMRQEKGLEQILATAAEIPCTCPGCQALAEAEASRAAESPIPLHTSPKGDKEWASEALPASQKRMMYHGRNRNWTAAYRNPN